MPRAVHNERASVRHAVDFFHFSIFFFFFFSKEDCLGQSNTAVRDGQKSYAENRATRLERETLDYLLAGSVHNQRTGTTWYVSQGFLFDKNEGHHFFAIPYGNVLKQIFSRRTIDGWSSRGLLAR